MARVNPYKLPLTADEHTAISFIARGMVREAAALEMGVPTDTLKSMLRRVYAKTKTNNSAQAVAVLMSRGDLRPSHVIPGVEDGWGGPASDLIHSRLLTEIDPDNLEGLNDAYKTLLRNGM